jgi:hypothetical protein
MTKEQAEAANWRIVRTWADNLGLEYGGVDLADGAAYLLLMVLGNLWLPAFEPEGGAA